MAIGAYYLQPQMQTEKLINLMSGLFDLCDEYDLLALLERAAIGDYRWTSEQAKRDATALRELAAALGGMSK